MGKYGLRIKNYSAGSVYEYNLGVRNNLDYKDAMLSNSLFLDFLYENGIETHKDEATRDVICIDFNYGSSSYEDQLKKNDKVMRAAVESENEEKIAKIKEIRAKIEENSDKFVKKSADDIRHEYYEHGVDIEYVTYNKKGNVKDREKVHYRMLYRTPGKAKNGSCMFICDRLYDIARDFLWMGIELPEENAPIVEIMAYSSLITSSIVGRIKIDPDRILVIKDVDAFLNTDVISVEIDERKQCFAKKINDYKLKNTLWDGQALIDSSIFPDWGEGYILLRHHFMKCAAFESNIQLFFKDYFGENYGNAKVKDMFGNEMYAKDVLLITTENALKFLKFDISFDYWKQKVRENGCIFGIVKTAHQSKLGNVQKMSYQMVNSLNIDTMESVIDVSSDYINSLKSNDEEFLKYLKDNINFSNDFDVLIALCEQDPLFVRSEYFRERKKKIIDTYVINFRSGKVIQNADNLVIAGSPYAMLLASVGEDPFNDDTFSVEEGTIQCFTERFDDGEYLAEFRSPFNSRNNLGYLHNVYNEKFKKYFGIGKQCIAINMIGTPFQDRNNGLTQWLGSTAM